MEEASRNEIREREVEREECGSVVTATIITRGKKKEMQWNENQTLPFGVFSYRLGFIVGDCQTLPSLMFRI